MESTGPVIASPADEESGDSEYDSVVGTGRPDATREEDKDEEVEEEEEEEEEDKESVVAGAGGKTDEREGDRDDDGDKEGEEDHDEEEGGGGQRRSPEVGGRSYESVEEEGDAVGDEEAARERNRRFWEACLASGYP